MDSIITMGMIGLSDKLDLLSLHLSLSLLYLHIPRFSSMFARGCCAVVAMSRAYLQEGSWGCEDCDRAWVERSGSR